ncbi:MULTISPECIES: glycosyltransferase family 4 protein, partial [Nitrosomonas]|uniref:Glycosyltransferase involved in cell wall biosynthesis n=1 Tax=Nitrosomonas communis TaxID=44574 RepID=A0A5D3YH81_9PROT
MIKLLVDGVFFQLSNSGIARVWRSVLELLVADGRFQIYFLDRGKAPSISGIEYIPFPSYLATNCPADSQLIQDICDFYQIDVFSSTYYTTPISTPMVLMVHDMIPELFNFDLSHTDWMEKMTAICYAQRYLCVSENTRNDLLAIYPEIPPDLVITAYNGLDHTVFHQHEIGAIEAFRNQYELDRPYFLFVGSRVQHNGYKNSGLFFDALASMKEVQFDVFCVGGERQVEQEILDKLPSGVRCKRVELTDEELALAYGGALALVYPSLYEGFGMPVIEAMASGCPVITTSHGSLAETAGDAALLISGISADEMRSALIQIQDPSIGDTLRQKGLVHAQRFRWEVIANKLATIAENLVKESRAGAYDNFFLEWKRLRQIQANVDYAQ